VKADKLSMYSRPIIASLLVSSGLLQLAAPVLANGTAAGTQITNTATASYEDPTDLNKPLNTFSNTVKVAVAEVAGLTLTANTFSVVDGTTLVPTNAGAVPGNKVYFDYTITNVGNDPTQIRVPGTAKVTGAGRVEQVQYWDGTTWVNIPNAGEFISGSKDPGETLKVRVITLVLAGAVTGDELIVTLGNTLTPDGQNVLRDSTGGDVYTVDGPDGTPTDAEVDGAPENGVREAAATQKVVIGATPEAFVTITKVRGTQNPGANAAILSDDTFTYDLGLKVANQADLPVGSTKSAADLEDTTVPGIGSGILVSDAVPANTTVESLTVPAGWVAVYTVDPTTTAANAATWVEIPGGPGVVTVPTPPSGTISRVGFVKKRPTGSTTPISIAKGSTVSGMAVTVKLTGFTAAGGTVANIAQVFGSTNVNGTPKLVFDESGDQNPNNYTSGNTPGPVDVAGNPVITSGVASSTDPDTDVLNNNSGSGPGGEPNVVNVLPVAQTGILNGTGGRPDAFGPTGTNDDFTNISTPIPATTWSLNSTTGVYTANPIDPASAGFANTFQTAAGSPTQSVNLMPTTPTTALPAGTKVTITFGATSKTFVTDPTGLIFYNDGTTTPATPLVVPNVVAATPVNYGTEIDLPSGTAQLKGYGVPIVAFVDNGTGPAGLDPSDTQNITIDRVYTGYLKLNKEVQILEADGTSPVTPPTNVRPGQLLQYIITYTNISDIAPLPVNGKTSGSIALNAQNIKITEDGTAAPNNWAKIDPVTNAPITGHQTDSAKDSNNGLISFDNGASANTSANVGIYKDVIAGPLAPQQFGTFRFTRVVK
jgi:hypothetical protein